MRGIFHSWGLILAGYTPSLSIEITRECPLRCPGCYAYGDDHLGGALTLRQVSDLKGDALVDGVLALVREHRPLHISIVGGEPLVRYRELDRILPALAAMGRWVQVVTSAVRPIPAAWATLPRLKVVVSIDGLQPEHDDRRKPATYDRILKHIQGHRITVHCTVTRQQVQRRGYLEEFVRFWQNNPHTKQIWVSLYTPQRGEVSDERLTAQDRLAVCEDLLRLRKTYSKLDMAEGLINVLARPPDSPEECIFARVTRSVTADLDRKIEPCQFGGDPECESCGCIASAALGAVGRHRLPGGVRVESIFNASFKVGQLVRQLRPPTDPEPKPAASAEPA
ncbi:MAG: radical SAM protein [Acidobacteria bacterium]|nr:radical SAM protein [Acidobacteriota bacterium]